MERVSGRFWAGWLACAALGLVLSAGGGAVGAPPEAADPSAKPVEPAAEPSEPAAGSPPPVGAAPPAASGGVSAAITVIGHVEVRPGGASEGRLVQIVDTERRRKLIVDEVGAGRALSKHAGERVSATGVVSQRKDGREVLLLSSFRPLGS